MSYVGQIPETDAGPDLKPLYQQIHNNYGFVPNYFQSQGTLPQAIEAQLEISKAILKDGALPTAVKEQIGLVVSGINSSSYCIAAHMQALRNLGIEETLGYQLATDYAAAPVPAKVMALFRFADKLTRKPVEIDKPDVDAVFKAGWDEAALRETVLTVAYFNFINRVSFGLGLVGDF